MGHKVSLLFLLLIVGIILFFLLSPLMGKKDLPILGMPGHTVEAFKLIDQDGDTITSQKVDGTVRVVEFFFTTCRGICPIMNQHLRIVNEKFAGDSGVVILSHTVNPAYDNPAVLKKYADAMGASAGKWYFFTGTKQVLYELAAKSYLLNTDTISDLPVGTTFFHTPNVTLVDKEGRIRGFYDATDAKEVGRLMRDIGQLR